MNLIGEILPKTPLKFDAGSTSAISESPWSGIRLYGPYDKAVFPKDCLRCAAIYPSSANGEKDRLIKTLTDGEGGYPGFEPWFRVGMSVDEVRLGTPKESEYTTASKEVSNKGYDLVFVLTYRRGNSVYRDLKSILLGNGIPCQFVIIETLRSQQLQWIVSNIALACYAKVGGTPWVVAAQGRNEIVVGVSRAQDKSKTFLVGFCTVFEHNGDFALFHSKAPVVEWDRYIAGLKGLVVETVDEYSRKQKRPDSLVIHFRKRPGFRERQAVEEALRELGYSANYALLHLNEHSSYRLFDTSHYTYVPPTGLKVNLGSHQAMLLLDGREGDEERRRIGVPNVLEIVMDRNSTMSVDEFPRLVKQVFDFSRVNWRGFNARSMPATINYSYLISRLVIEIGRQNWNPVVASGKLRDKAWFL